MCDEQKEREVFDQDLSMGDLDAAAGGGATWWYDKDDDANNCTSVHEREIYGGGGFPNCAATVEDGSWCDKNDACLTDAVRYKGRKDCGKAWK